VFEDGPPWRVLPPLVVVVLGDSGTEVWGRGGVVSATHHCGKYLLHRVAVLLRFRGLRVGSGGTLTQHYYGAQHLFDKHSGGGFFQGGVCLHLLLGGKGRRRAVH
jgi:hypothetical protein